jgi:3-methyl-2-oxobutanoate hydroxymethyltransferase
MAATWIASATRRVLLPRACMSSRPVVAAATAAAPAAAAPAAAAGKVTVLDLKRHRRTGRAVTVMTAYDYPTALLVDRAGVDVVLVGDSLAMVALGHTSTTSLTMNEMVHHCRAVARGSTRALRVGDMPFGSYQVSADDAVRNAVRLVAEGGMEAVKLEGGADVAETARRIVRAGIPVMGHVGLTPQSQSALGGYRVQARTAAEAAHLLRDVQALEDAGCFSVVLECVPARVAQVVTERVGVLTIGIGAGVHTGGQVLVLNDMLGLFDRFVPRFCKQYAQLGHAVGAALAHYNADVHARAFPAPEHSYPMKPDEEALLNAWAATIPRHASDAPTA